MELKYEKEAKLFKAFCDPNRLMILEKSQSGEKCACNLLADLDIVQSTLSHHMKILCESGFVVGRKEGKWMHYSLDTECFETANKFLQEFQQKEVLCDNQGCGCSK